MTSSLIIPVVSCPSCGQTIDVTGFELSTFECCGQIMERECASSHGAPLDSIRTELSELPRQDWERRLSGGYVHVLVGDTPYRFSRGGGYLWTQRLHGETWGRAGAGLPLHPAAL